MAHSGHLFCSIWPKFNARVPVKYIMLCFMISDFKYFLSARSKLKELKVHNQKSYCLYLALISSLVMIYQILLEK